MEEIVQQLNISKGSASQGLRQLEELNAIIKSRESGERSHTFTARLELKPLLGGFLSKRLAPRLAANTKRVKDLQQLLPQLAPARPARREAAPAAADQMAQTGLDPFYPWRKGFSKATDRTSALRDQPHLYFGPWSPLPERPGAAACPERPLD